jgi:hypothetical protein
MRISGAVTPIFVRPVEIPAPCHVRLGEATVKPCESFAVCKTRLSLPYLLRSTSLLRQCDKGTSDAKGLTESGPRQICETPSARISWEIKLFDCQSRHRPRASGKPRAWCQPPDTVTCETPLTPFLAHFSSCLHTEQRHDAETLWPVTCFSVSWDERT